MKRIAFTVMEAMVVVAILMILVALSGPALFRAKEEATQAKCTSNLRQLSVAIELYRQEWEGGGTTTAAMGYPPLLSFYELQEKIGGTQACSASP